jgi:hypothetical protein
MFFQASTIEDVQQQVLPGEIYVPVDEGRTGGIMTPTGVYYAPDTLAQLRDKRWEQAKTYRTLRMANPCITQVGTVDIDAASLQKIGGAVTAALIAKMTNQPLVFNWTMHDNSVIPLNADAIITMGQEVAAYINACQAAGTTIRNTIYSSPASALNAIDITYGYP